MGGRQLDRLQSRLCPQDTSPLPFPAGAPGSAHNGQAFGHIVEAKLLDRAPRQPGDDRLIRLVAGIAAAAPDRTLQQIAAQLEAMRERTPRGGTRWPSSVKHLLTRAEQLGLAGTPPAQVDPQVWR